MTKEEYNFLSKFTSNFKTVEESGYSRNIGRKDRKKLKAIYEKEQGEKYLKNIFCSACLAELLSLLKPHYNKYSEKLNRKKENETATEEESSRPPEEV
ncbi:MAG: hypothetical protein LUF85_06495 [Bacteroides sp.]|nr:hypothetical protein [Bacteroides sp.]